MDADFFITTINYEEEGSSFVERRLSYPLQNQMVLIITTNKPEQNDRIEREALSKSSIIECRGLLINLIRNHMRYL